MNQRQLRRSLASTSEGVAGQIAGLEAELENNRLESPEIRNRLRQIEGEISRLNRDPLSDIEQQMTMAVKNLGNDTSPSGPELKSALTSAGRRQDEVVESLEKLLADLGQWNNLRGCGAISAKFAATRPIWKNKRAPLALKRSPAMPKI